MKKLATPSIAENNRLKQITEFAYPPRFDVGITLKSKHLNPYKRSSVGILLWTSSGLEEFAFKVDTGADFTVISHEDIESSGIKCERTGKFTHIHTAAGKTDQELEFVRFYCRYQQLPHVPIRMTALVSPFLRRGSCVLSLAEITRMFHVYICPKSRKFPSGHLRFKLRRRHVTGAEDAEAVIDWERDVASTTRLYGYRPGPGR